MEIQKYQWRTASMARGIDPEKALEELQQIEKTFGALTAKNVVEAARAKDNVLHTLFEWDNKKAAENYRLQQARQLINNLDVIVVSDGQPKEVPVFEITKQEDSSRSYKAVTEFSLDDAEQVKRQVLRDISYLRKKLSFFDKFGPASDKLGEAENLLQ